MIDNFKQLDWQIRDDDVVHADPIGLITAYYIYPPKTENNSSSQFELVLIQENGDFDEEETTRHNTLNTAKSKAQQHYEYILQLHCNN
jgi:hypothetical protein